MRVTIKPYLTEYVTQIGAELGIDDVTEVVSLIVLDHKRGLCHCSQLHDVATDSVAPSAKDPNEALADGLEDLLNY